MNYQELTTEVQNVINAHENKAVGNEEAIKHLLELFVQAAKPLNRSREHLQLFIFRVSEMRKLQQAYFKGDNKALVSAKRHEVQVDNAIIKLCSDFGYKVRELEKKYEQQKLL